MAIFKDQNYVETLSHDKYWVKFIRLEKYKKYRFKRI